jgi:hypothetical protein
MIPTPGSVQPWARVTEAWCYDDPALPQAIDQLVIDAMDKVPARSVVIH